jgi:hypothetical protein
MNVKYLNIIFMLVKSTVIFLTDYCGKKLSLNFHIVPEKNDERLQASESLAHDCNSGPPEDEGGS